MPGHESSSSISWSFYKYENFVNFSCTFDNKCSTNNLCSFSLILTFRNKYLFIFTWTFSDRVSFGFSCKFSNKRSSKFLRIGNEWDFDNLYEGNDQLYKVSFFKTSDYDLDKYERSAKYKKAKLILCEKCNQKINSIMCFKCYDEVTYNHEKYNDLTMIGTCGSCFEIIKNYDGCSFCKLKHIFINFISYLLNMEFNNYDSILCLECNQNIDRLLICFNCYNEATNDEEKNRMMFGRCKDCNQVITEYYGCLSCNPQRFKRKFDKWNSGNTEINELIRNKQIFACDFNDILEWIPYDRFENIKYITEGGFAKVYSATWIDGYIIKWDQEHNNWKRSGKDKVALKVLKNSTEMSLDFLNEIKNLTRIPNNCRGIVKFYGITQDPKTSNYALVFKLEDYDLRYCLDQYFNPVQIKKGYIESICSGLKNIHRQGLIHKDLHLGNILCSGFSYAYISDFGLCKPANENSPTDITNTYGVVPYMAPEILRGKEYTQASDVYSLGVIINEMVSVIPPFCDRPHDHYLAIDICFGLRPTIRKDLPCELKVLIQECWDADPKNRPTSEVVLSIIEKLQCTALSFDFNDPMTTTKIDPQAIYTSRLLNFKNLPEPVNCLKQEEFISSRYIMQVKSEVINHYSDCLDCIIVN